MSSSITSSDHNLKSERNVYMDSVGGLMIINMVLVHSWTWAKCTDYGSWHYILTFFMPWFFYKAGMFYKPTVFSIIFKKSYKRLIIPYIIFSIIGSILYFLLQYSTENISVLLFIRKNLRSLIGTGAVFGNLPLWFLLSLFVIRLVYNYFHQLIFVKNYYSILIFIFVLPLFLYYLQESISIRLPVYFYNVPCGLAFFAFGFCTRNLNLQKRYILYIIIIYSVIMALSPQSVDMRANRVNAGSFLGWYLISGLGIIGLDGLFYFLFNKKNILSFIGEHSMEIYCWHWICLILLYMFIAPLVDNSYLYFFIEVLMLPILIASCCRLGCITGLIKSR